MGETKYTDGSPKNISEISEEERKVAFREWSEGNKELEKLLWNSQEIGMVTMASCGGHNHEGGYAYVAFDLKGGNTDKILDILAVMEETKVPFMYGFINQNRSIADRSFVSVMAQKAGINEAFFERINDVCKQIENGKKINPELRQKYETLKNITVDKRIERYDRGTQIRVEENKDEATITGLLGYGYKRLPIAELLKLGKAFKENPGTQIPYELDESKMVDPQVEIQDIKNVATKSKTPWSFIKNSYNKIKENLQKKRENIRENQDYTNDKEGDEYGEV